MEGAMPAPKGSMGRGTGVAEDAPSALPLTRLPPLPAVTPLPLIGRARPPGGASPIGPAKPSPPPIIGRFAMGIGEGEGETCEDDPDCPDPAAPLRSCRTEPVSGLTPPTPTWVIGATPAGKPPEVDDDDDEEEDAEAAIGKEKGTCRACCGGAVGGGVGAGDGARNCRCDAASRVARLDARSSLPVGRPDSGAVRERLRAEEGAWGSRPALSAAGVAGVETAAGRVRPVAAGVLTSCVPVTDRVRAESETRC